MFSDNIAARVNRGSRYYANNGGKSGLHRAERQVTPGGRKPMESAAEKIPPNDLGKGEMVR